MAWSSVTASRRPGRVEQAQESEIVGQIGQGRLDAAGIELRLVILDQVELGLRAMILQEDIGRVPERGHGHVAFGQFVGPQRLVVAVENDLQPRFGAESLEDLHPRLVGRLVDAPIEDVNDAFGAAPGEMMGEAQDRVGPAVVDADGNRA